MSDFATFVAHVRQIGIVISKAEAARRLPAERVSAVQGIDFHSSGYSSSLSAEQKIIAERMRATAEVEERQAGEVARDRELKRLAVELDELRKALTGLASEAAFALVDQVREWRL